LAIKDGAGRIAGGCVTPNAAQTSTTQQQKTRINILVNKMNIHIYIEMFPVGQAEYKLFSV
jgi:hypothetical protein